MLDDFSLIPGEAFEAMGSVSNNLIDKISNAVGHVFSPRGKQKDKEEAVKFWIEEIKNNESMPALAKAAAISEARKIIKQYSNKNNILQIAINNLGDTANPYRLEEDWIEIFMDKAGKISNEDVQLMFGKLLAEECNNPNSVSKSLLNALTLMDKRLANSFKTLCKYSIHINDETHTDGIEVIIPDVTDMEAYNITLQFMDIVDLASLGLLEYNMGQYVMGQTGTVRYGDERIAVKGKEPILCGMVNTTSIGQELAKVIIPEVDYIYFEKIKKFWTEHDVNISTL